MRGGGHRRARTDILLDLRAVAERGLETELVTSSRCHHGALAHLPPCWFICRAGARFTTLVRDAEPLVFVPPGGCSVLEAATARHDQLLAFAAQAVFFGRYQAIHVVAICEHGRLSFLLVGRFL